ncbi:MAG: ribosome silencing factor [Lachnospiraceae bacterium]|nr:ribosome silencing factor [Lachnospiraceae bacterium]
MSEHNSKEMARLAHDALAEKKAEDIKIINIEQVSVIADYFIIATGNNRNQIQAMADNVEEVMGKAGYPVRQTEGYRTANWVLMDYGDIIVHVFDSENRLFYDLERIWRDGQDISYEDLLAGEEEDGSR